MFFPLSCLFFLAELSIVLAICSILKLETATSTVFARFLNSNFQWCLLPFDARIVHFATRDRLGLVIHYFHRWF